MLFTDGSVNPQKNIGYGAYLYISEDGLSLDFLKTQLIVKRFENTSSTKLELQTLLWALSDIQKIIGKLIIYTDSKNILGLENRRYRLEQINYSSKKNKCLDNYDLYKNFYKIIDSLSYQFSKVDGHLPAHKKNDIDNIFTLVDRASRKSLRDEIKKSYA